MTRGGGAPVDQHRALRLDRDESPEGKRQLADNREGWGAVAQNDAHGPRSFDDCLGLVAENVEESRAGALGLRPSRGDAVSFVGDEDAASAAGVKWRDRREWLLDRGIFLILCDELGKIAPNRLGKKVEIGGGVKQQAVMRVGRERSEQLE